MIKAGLIGAVTGFIFVMSLSLLSPFCTLCYTPLLGLGVGYLSGWFDAPLEAKVSLSRGGIAGGIAGIGAVAGQTLAAIVYGILFTHSEKWPNILREMGGILGEPKLFQSIIADPGEYWQALLTTSILCSAFNLVIVAGLGAVGGIMWFQRQTRLKLRKSLPQPHRNV